MRGDELILSVESAPAPRPAAAPAPAGFAAPAAPARRAAVAPDASSMLRALGRRLTPALALGVAAAALVGSAAWYLVPPAKFKTQALLQLFVQQPKVLFATADLQGGGGDDYRRYQRTQATLVKSRFVLSAALRREGVAKCSMFRQVADPLDWLQRQLEVDFVRDSELMSIALAGDSPKELALVVNAVKDAYMEEVVEIEHRRRVERNDVLNNHNKLYTDLLKNRRAALKKLAETVGSDDRQTLAYKQQIAMEHLAVVRKELLEVESRRRRAEARIKALRGEAGVEETSARDVSEEEVAAAVEAHPEVVELHDRLADLDRTFASAKAYQKKIARRPGTDPALGRLSNEVESLRQALAGKRAEVRPAVLGAMRDGAVVGGDGGALVEARRELSEIEYLEGRLQEQLKGLAASNQDLSVNTLGIQEIQDEISQYQATAARIGSEVEALKVELEAPPRVRQIEEAPVPLVKDDKKRNMMTVLAAAGAFVASLVGVTLLELRSQRIDHMDAVQTHVGLSIVGALPKLPAQARGGVVRAKDRLWHSRLLESIDATRTMLVHAAGVKSYQVVMIASAMPNEGKTSLASHLATSLARSGQRTLLIDADLRNASVHRLFDMPAEPGLSEALRGEVDAEAVAIDSAVEGLRVVPAGRCDARSLQALSRGALAKAFARLRQDYDFVIVDTSPILPVADALLVAQQVDAVLFSIFRDVSRRAQVLSAVERLARLNVDVLGAVVTGAEGSASEYAYYGSYAAAGRDEAPGDEGGESC